MTCSVEGCDRVVVTRGWCKGHYTRWIRHGTVQADKPIDYRLRPIGGYPKSGTPQCREYQGVREDFGYAKPGCLRGKKLHRWVMEQALGRTLGAKEVVRHTCDTPACFLFAHLRLGTQADNVADMVERDRQFKGPKVWGENHGAARLTEADVLTIRASGAPTPELVERFGVSRFAVWEARTGRTWRHLPMPGDDEWASLGR